MTDITNLLTDADSSVGYMVAASAPILWEASFSRVPGEEPGSTDDMVLKFNAAYHRETPRHLGVELTASIQGVPWVHPIVVSYRVSFVIIGSIGNEELSSVVELLARQIGPSTVYPFVRETVASLTARTGDTINLPLVNWAAAFAGDLEIPAPVGETPPELLEMPGRTGGADG